MSLWQRIKAFFGGAPSASKEQQGAGGSPSSRASSSSSSSAAGASELGELDVAAHRARALALRDGRSPWWWRRDVIPPASDERTALVERGMVLRGLVDEDELAALHALGDRVLRVQEAEQLAASAGHRSGREAVEALRQARLALKAEKQAAAAARRRARAAAVVERRAHHIDFLGRGVSALLHQREARADALRARGLPVLADARDVAAFLEVDVARLRWLAFHPVATARPHYAYFRVPKKSGGTRLLSAPMPELARAQRLILTGILQQLPVDDVVHGFVPGRSIVTNARPHAGKAVVVNVDLRDFFGSVGFARVRGLLTHLGYSPCAASLLAALCTEEVRVAVDVDARGALPVRAWVAQGGPVLPQGACTSPALANQIARRLDRRLVRAAQKLGFVYTRYADDLTFSADGAAAAQAPALLSIVHDVVADEGFCVHPDKVRVLRRQSRQEVTGVVVNDGLTLPRKERRRLRAALHQRERGTLDESEAARLQGRLAYLRMVDPARAARLVPPGPSTKP